MKISEMITDRYKLRIPPTVYYDLKADIVNYEEEFEWCETCKEYDQEKHCCHRWSKVIRDTVEEMKQEPFINKPCVSSGVCEHDKNKVLDKIRAEITNCLKALDEIEKSGFNIYLPNEISGRRLTYQQCLEFIDKYKAETEET